MNHDDQKGPIQPRLANFCAIEADGQIAHDGIVYCEARIEAEILWITRTSQRSAKEIFAGFSRLGDGPVRRVRVVFAGTPDDALYLEDALCGFRECLCSSAVNDNS